MKKIVSAVLTVLCAVSGLARPASVGERLLAAGAVAEVVSDTVMEVCPGVTEADLHIIKADGNPVRLFVVEADMTNPGLSFEVSTPGDTCVASGQSRQTLSGMARDADRPGHRVVAMVNADFWDVKTMEVRGPLHRRGKVVKDHFVYTPRLWQQALSFIGVFDNGTVAIADTLAYHGAVSRLREVTGAGVIVLRDGEIPHVPEKYIDPRTCIGYTSKGKIYLLTADGRADGYSVGLTYPEMGAVMQALGCISAANLDGGGSAQMIVRQPDGSFMIRNRPTDGKERPVINGWMIVADKE